jgi:hypothetical protein
MGALSRAGQRWSATPSLRRSSRYRRPTWRGPCALTTSIAWAMRCCGSDARTMRSAPGSVPMPRTCPREIAARLLRLRLSARARSAARIGVRLQLAGMDARSACLPTRPSARCMGISRTRTGPLRCPAATTTVPPSWGSGCLTWARALATSTCKRLGCCGEAWRCSRAGTWRMAWDWWRRQRQPR